MGPPMMPSNTRAPDHAVRLQALDPRQSIVLEAPAGSGKTALLTARFLALLAEVRHPRQILAVTFTRRAAAEMAARISGTLRLAREGRGAAPDNPWEQHLLDLARAAICAHPDWKALFNGPQAFLVDTFHGFCARLARAWPLEAGVAPAFALLDELGQDALIESAVTDLLQAFAVCDPGLGPEVQAAFERRLAAAHNNARALSERLADLLARRDRLEGLLGVFRQARPDAALEARVGQLAGVFLAPIQAFFAGRAADWQALRERLERNGGDLAHALAPAVPGAGLADLPAWREAAEVFLTQGGTPRRAFPAARFGPAFAEDGRGAFIRGLPPAVAQALHAVRAWPEADPPVGLEALGDFMVLARALLDRFAFLLRVRGLDFMELELAALRAFSRVDRPGDSLIFFHEHLRHVLVDEAQDMNDTQVRILGALTEGWEPGDGRTVFVVGDPKQSIFRFRRADVALFEALLAGGLPRPGEAPLPLRPLTLSANFRSRPHLVAFANAAFSRIMADPQPAFDEVAFHPSVAARAPSGAPESAPTLALFTHRGRSQEPGAPTRAAAREKEAAYVAGRVAVLHATEPDARIALLIPARTHLTPYVRALRESALPVRLMEGVPMPDCPEVRHLLSLFTALARPCDDLAWAAAVRAPWCSVPAGALERLAARESPARWSDRILEAGRLEHSELARFAAAVNAIRPEFGREPYAVSLQRLWELLGGPAAVARRAGAGGLAAVRHGLDLLASCPAGSAGETLDTWSRLLDRAYTPPDPRAAFSPISVMTIHKAKGLEFDHVFAVGLDREAGGRAGRQDRMRAFLMERLPGAARAVLASAGNDRGGGKPPLGHVLLDALGRRREAGEYKRLIYVAATRARESLTLSGLMDGGRVTDDEPETPGLAGGRSPLAWFDALARSEALAGIPVRRLTDPQPEERPPAAARPPVRLPAPAPFDPAPLPYRIASPSAFEEDTAMAMPPGADEPDPEARARGVVMHRLFESLARGRPLPPADAVAAALAAEGITPARRRAAARAALDECRRAWAFPALAERRAAASKVLSEWGLEDCPGPGRIRVGRIDLVLQTDAETLLVDFKTGQPGGDLEGWIEAERARYRPQVAAYRDMAARTLRVAPDRIRAVLFFTTPLRWEPVD